MEERLKSHYESLDRAIGFTRLADTKAAPLLGLQVALLGTMAARFDRYQPILVSDQWDLERILVIAVIGLYSIFAIAAVGFASWVYVPITPKSDNNPIYFEDIASMDVEGFKVVAKELRVDVIEEGLLDQIHRVSGIASAKMKRVRWAFILSGPTTVLWIIALALGSAQSTTT